MSGPTPRRPGASNRPGLRGRLSRPLIADHRRLLTADYALSTAHCSLFTHATAMRKIPLLLIRGYQLVISPLLPPSCRFHPTCSEYGYEAIAKYGIIKGGWLTAKRVLRCNPFSPGGYDPVP